LCPCPEDVSSFDCETDVFGGYERKRIIILLTVKTYPTFEFEFFVETPFNKKNQKERNDAVEEERNDEVDDGMWCLWKTNLDSKTHHFLEDCTVLYCTCTVILVPWNTTTNKNTTTILIMDKNNQRNNNTTALEAAAPC
jgi:hypothetical protein